MNKEERPEDKQNVYAAIGVPDPEGMLRKTDVVIEIEREVRARGLTPEAAARVLGLSAEALDSLLHGHFHATPVEALTSYIQALRGYRSDLLESIHEVAKAMHSVRAIDSETMREFDDICLQPNERLTRDFKASAIKRVNLDPESARALYAEAVELLLNGDEVVARDILLAAMNETDSFESRVKRLKGSNLTQEYQSEPMEALHSMAENLHEVGLIDKKTMREFDRGCLVPKPRKRGGRRKRKEEPPQGES